MAKNKVHPANVTVFRLLQTVLFFYILTVHPFHLVDATVGSQCTNTTDCNTTSEVCITSKCKCTDSYVEQSDGSCKKIGYGGLCESSSQAADICKEANTTCMLDSTKRRERCLCMPDFFRHDVCEHLHNVEVTNVSCTSSTDRVRCTFLTSNDFHGIIYSLAVNGSTETGLATSSWGSVYGLTPGTQYTFKIISRVLKKFYEPEKTTEVLKTGVWTIPEKPGSVNDVEMVSDSTYNITFMKSDGNVERYEFMLFKNGNGTKKEGSLAMVTFSDLNAGTTYNYKIIAYNGNGDPSTPYEGSLTTDTIAPGPVNNLAEGDKTTTSMTVTWQKPLDPNGDIIGYQAFVHRDSQCLHVFKIQCTSCQDKPRWKTTGGCKIHDDSFHEVRLNDPLKVFRINIEDLKPYKEYNVKVTAFTKAGGGQERKINVTTEIAAGTDLKSVRIGGVSDGWTGLRIEWEQGEETGPTTYYILLKEETSRGTGIFEKVDEIIVKGYEQTDRTVSNLLAYWNYQVFVTAATDAGNSSQYGPVGERTPTSAPGLVKTFSVLQNDTTASELSITVACPEEKKRNGIIQEFVIRKSLLGIGNETDLSENYTVQANSKCDNSTYTDSDVGDILVERSYRFEVAAQNQDYTGEFSKKEVFEVKARAPLLKALHQTTPVISIVGNNSSSVTVKVCASCVTDAKQGTVKAAGLVVCKGNSIETCSLSEWRLRSVDTTGDFHLYPYPTWALAKKGGFELPFRATPNDWHKILEGRSDYTYTIGDNTNCSLSQIYTYCNGPLPDGKEFVISLIVCNDGGCDQVDEYLTAEVSATSEESKTGLIIGIVFGVIGAITLVVVGIIWYRCKKSKDGTKNESGGGMELNPSELGINMSNAPAGYDGPCNNPKNTTTEFDNIDDYDYIVDHTYPGTSQNLKKSHYVNVNDEQPRYQNVYVTPNSQKSLSLSLSERRGGIGGIRHYLNVSTT